MMMMANNHLCVLGPHVKPYYSLTCSSVQFMKICAVWDLALSSVFLFVIKQWDRIVYCSRVHSASQHNKHIACFFMNMNEAVKFKDNFIFITTFFFFHIKIIFLFIHLRFSNKWYIFNFWQKAMFIFFQ